MPILSTLRSTAGIRSRVQPSANSSISLSILTWCTVTPRTRSAAYGETGGLPWVIRSASRSRTGASRSSASKRMSRARLRALLRAGGTLRPAEVLAGPGVDLDLLAGRDEQRHLDGGAGLEGGRLGAAGGPVALDAGVGLADGELDRGRQVDVQGGAVVERHRDGLLLEQVTGRVTDHRRGNPRLVVVLHVHEDEVGALAVQVLHLAPVDIGHVHLDAGVEGAVDDLARHDVLQLAAHEGAALARLDMLELDDGPELAVEVQRHAVLQVVRGRHVVSPRSENEKFPGRRREQARPAGSYDQDVLDPDTAPAG